MFLFLWFSYIGTKALFTRWISKSSDLGKMDVFGDVHVEE